MFLTVTHAFSAVVLYDYDPEVADELKLRVGDVLTNIKKIEDGWCQGVLNGKTGMFPDNFVKVELLLFSAALTSENNPVRQSFTSN